MNGPAWAVERLGATPLPQSDRDSAEAQVIRKLAPEDYDRLREIHAKQGFSYPYPNLHDPNFVEKWAFVDDGGDVVQCVLARRTVELFFIADPEYASPRWRYEAFRLMHEHMRLRLHDEGYRDAHLWIPPPLVKSFARRLRNGFGWLRNEWLCLSRTTERIT